MRKGCIERGSEGERKEWMKGGRGWRGREGGGGGVTERSKGANMNRS